MGIHKFIYSKYWFRCYWQSLLLCYHPFIIFGRSRVQILVGDRLLWPFLWLYSPQDNAWSAPHIRTRPIPYKPLIHCFLIILWFDIIQSELLRDGQRCWASIRNKTNWLYRHYLWNSVYQENIDWRHAQCWKHAKPHTKLSLALLLRRAQTGNETSF